MPRLSTSVFIIMRWFRVCRCTRTVSEVKFDLDNAIKLLSGVSSQLPLCYAATVAFHGCIIWDQPGDIWYLCGKVLALDTRVYIYPSPGTPVNVSTLRCMNYWDRSVSVLKYSEITEFVVPVLHKRKWNLFVVLTEHNFSPQFIKKQLYFKTIGLLTPTFFII